MAFTDTDRLGHRYCRFCMRIIPVVGNGYPEFSDGNTVSRCVPAAVTGGTEGSAKPAENVKCSTEYNKKGYHPPIVKNPEACVNCGLCEMLCPEFAIWSTLKEKAGK